MTAGFDTDGSVGSAGDGYRAPTPRQPVRETADCTEPGHRTRTAATPAATNANREDRP
jgi:hypothetical protein